MRSRGEEHLGAHRYVPEGAGRTPLLVGEDNPHSGDPRHALFPHPVGCAGQRFAERIAGWGTSGQLAAWRTNLCVGRWSDQEARARAYQILRDESPPWRVVVLLGRKVARAFRSVEYRVCDEAPFSSVVVTTPPFNLLTLVYLPHPSGRCRAWNDPGAAQRARALLAKVGAV